MKPYPHLHCDRCGAEMDLSWHKDAKIKHVGRKLCHRCSVLGQNYLNEWIIDHQPTRPLLGIKRNKKAC